MRYIFSRYILYGHDKVWDFLKLLSDPDAISLTFGVFSYVMLNDQNVKSIYHKLYNGMVLHPCVFYNVSSVHLIVQISTHILPTYICMVFPLQKIKQIYYTHHIMSYSCVNFFCFRQCDSILLSSFITDQLEPSYEMHWMFEVMFFGLKIYEKT